MSMMFGEVKRVEAGILSTLSGMRSAPGRPARPLIAVYFYVIEDSELNSHATGPLLGLLPSPVALCRCRLIQVAARHERTNVPMASTASGRS